MQRFREKHPTAFPSSLALFKTAAAAAAIDVCTVSPHGFPMLCCLCSSKKEDDIKPNGDNAKLRQSRREEMSKFWEHEHLLQINADANFNFPPTEAVLLLRQNAALETHADTP